MQYVQNTNTTNTHTDCYVFNTYLSVLNTYWYEYMLVCVQAQDTYWHVLRCNTFQYLHVAIIDVS